MATNAQHAITLAKELHQRVEPALADRAARLVELLTEVPADAGPSKPRDITQALNLGKKILAELQPTEYDTTDLELQVTLLDELDGRRSKRQKAYRAKQAKAKKAKRAKAKRA